MPNDLVPLLLWDDLTPDEQTSGRFFRLDAGPNAPARAIRRADDVIDSLIALDDAASRGVIPRADEPPAPPPRQRGFDIHGRPEV